MKSIFITLLFAIAVFAQPIQRVKHITPIIESVLNSSNTSIAKGDSFVGGAEDLVVLGAVQTHISIHVRPSALLGDDSTAVGSFVFEYSPDSTTWYTSVTALVREPAVFIPYALITVNKYFRVKYFNDGGALAISVLGLPDTVATTVNQTYFDITTLHFRTGTKELGRTLDQGISGSDPVTLSRSVIMGKDPLGVYRNVETDNFGNLMTSNFLFRVAKGDFEDLTPIHKFGRNSDIDNGSEPETVWEAGGLKVWQTSAQTITVSSSSVLDVNTTGTGAHKLEIEGVDGSYAHTLDTLNLNGVVPVVSTESFLNVYRARIIEAGTGGSNAGTISGTYTTTTNNAFGILGGFNRTQLAFYTTADGETGQVTSVNLFPSSNPRLLMRLQCIYESSAGCLSCAERLAAIRRRRGFRLLSRSLSTSRRSRI